MSHLKCVTNRDKRELELCRPMRMNTFSTVNSHLRESVPIVLSHVRRPAVPSFVYSMGPHISPKFKDRCS